MCRLQGAALIRMLANVMGQSLFQKGLNVSRRLTVTETPQSQFTVNPTADRQRDHKAADF